jgi:hypothetical protein
MGFFDRLNGAIQSEREAVREAKANLKKLVNTRDLSIKEAKSSLKAKTREYEALVSPVRFRLNSLQSPGMGAHIGALGSVSLLSHAVEIKPGIAMPLVGLSLRVETTPTTTYIYFSSPDGRTAMAVFSTELRDIGSHSDSQGNVWIDQKRAFSDSQVRTFAALIEDAVKAEVHFQLQLPVLIEAAAAELAAKEAERGPVDEAEARLERLMTDHPFAADIKVAEVALAEAQAALERAKAK